MKFGKRATALGVTSAIAVLAAASPAAAAEVIGSDLADADTPAMLGPSTRGLIELPAANTASGGVTSPIDGVITGWRIRTGGPSAPTRLVVLRPEGDTSYTNVGETPDGQPAADAISAFGVHPGLPIRAGDHIGLQVPQGGQVPAVRVVDRDSALLATWLNRNLAPGSGAPYDVTSGNLELLIQATVEPDVDGDGLGDETQDPDGGTGEPCPGLANPLLKAVAELLGREPVEICL